MAIFIYEDNIIQSEQLKRIINGICKKNNTVPPRIIDTHRDEVIMKNISHSENNIYFLDIDIHGENFKGFELAKRIRKIDEQGIIVFITIYSNFAPISYGYMVSALNFIDKNLPLDHFKEQVEKCLQVFSMYSAPPEDDLIMIDKKTTKIKLKVNDIVLFEVVGPHKIEVFTNKGRRIIFQSNLKDLENMHPSLVKCHQSFIIHLDHVIEFDKVERTLTMSNLYKVPVSKRLSKKIKQLVHIG